MFVEERLQAQPGGILGHGGARLVPHRGFRDESGRLEGVAGLASGSDRSDETLEACGRTVGRAAFERRFSSTPIRGSDRLSRSRASGSSPQERLGHTPIDDPTRERVARQIDADAGRGRRR